MAEPENTSKAKRKCVGCGAELPGNAPPDLCPKCLLKLAMETQPAAGPSGTVIVSGVEPKPRGLPLPGEQLGHYAIIRPLGAGGMGAVYEAQDLENGRRVALKVLSHTLDSPEARERFLREGRLAASINHPNSVFVFGTEEIGGTPVIAMELVAGGTLQDRARAQGPLPIGEAVDCVLQIIEGLAVAQRIGILHRDVKPSNCYIDQDGTVKIGDFGLSISTAVRTESALTATGAFLGTPAFCSPEQLRGEALDARSDMYSVGATLFYLLTGRTPFEAPNFVQMLATVLDRRPTSPRKLRPEIPQGLAKAVLRCLEKQSGDRFKTYAELTRALEPYRSIAPTPATLGLRFLAGAVDMTVLWALAFVVNLTAFGTPMDFVNQAMARSPKVLAWIIAWFCLAIVYYALFEGLWGAAAGKALCRLRVVGRDRNPPGLTRALLRALIFVVPPVMPYWAAVGPDPQAYLRASQASQLLLGFSLYVIMALLFVTARRRNGFAAVQDLLTGTRVVSQAAIASRPVLQAAEPPAPVAESAITIGPYHVLQALDESAAGKWFLAYDLKLLRKVWIRSVPAGTEPLPVRFRDLGRVGRLRWLTGKRSPTENWDAFEALNGQPFLQLVNSRQPWPKVRYWLNDLATELSAAEKDGTLPDLALDRVWITGEGRAKLLDFPAPGLGGPAASPLSPAEPTPSSISFLNAVAAAALAGHPDGASRPASEVAAPLPLHARAFLKSLPQMAGTGAALVELKLLLSRAAEVSRLRRAALVAGCLAFPALAFLCGLLSLSFLGELTTKYPGVMDLNSLLHMRGSARLWSGKNVPWPTDRQLAIYIAHHYRGLITNEATWSNPFILSMINGTAREFAQRSVVEHSDPTPEEIREVDSAVKKFIPKQQPFGEKPPAWLPAMMLAGSLVIYVGLPALLAALLFRGGLMQRLAGVAYARGDGRPASRLRVFWRGIVAWSPSLLALVMSAIAINKQTAWASWVGLAILALLAATSVALPARGLQDRLAGTWPVPR